MKKKLVIILAIIILCTTGCTKNFTDKESKKRYTSNILCKPETAEVVKVYKDNIKEIDIKYEKLPSCEKFKITSGGYEGLWTSIFVKPLAWVIIKLGMIVRSYGLSIMILGFLIRLIMVPLTKKSTSMSKNMNKVKPEMDRLEKKYAGKTDQTSMNMKAQETMILYKKYNVNPLSGCLFALLQIPIFFAFLEAIQRIPVIYEEKLWVFELGRTPSEAIKLGQYYYLILVVIILVVTYLSFKNMNNGSMEGDQAKMMKNMNLFMVVFIGIASFSLPTAIAFYWIVSSLFTVVQNYIMNKSNSDEPKQLKAKKKTK